MLKIYLIAGEASGDNIGSKLMKALKSLDSQIEFFGIGGEKMQKEGMNLLFSANELAVMGFFEIIPHIFKFIKLLTLTEQNILEIKPDIVITIDSPGFSFRIAKKIRNKFSSKLVHYIAPTVWAYKPDRAKKIAQIYEHLLVILPFEPPYFEKEGLDTTFVGHPAIEDFSIDKAKRFRSKYNIIDQDLLICLAPGSRKQEINTLLPIFLEAIEIFKSKLKRKVFIAIPAKANLNKLIKSYLSVTSDVILVDEENKESLFSSSDIALTKSGTITTELAFYKIPMVVAHKVNPFSHWLLKKIIKVKYATIINIMADKELIPELLQEKCTPEMIANSLLDLTMPTSLKTWQENIQIELDKLKPKGEIPSMLAAKTILSLHNSG